MKLQSGPVLALILAFPSIVSAQSADWVRDEGFVQTKLIEDGFILKVSSVDPHLPLEIWRDGDGIYEVDRDLDAVYLIGTPSAAVLDDWGSVSFNAREGLLEVKVGGRTWIWGAGNRRSGLPAASIARYESPSVEDIYSSPPDGSPSLPTTECDVGGPTADFCAIDCGGGLPRSCSIHCTIQHACCTCVLSPTGEPRKAKCVCQSSGGGVP